MVYEIRQIAGKAQIEQCHSFEISNFQWRSIYRPRAQGCVGYIENKGFLVWLACEEVHPKADCVRNFDPIYKDSALDAFFQFDLENNNYFSFEFNARGACIASYGHTRHLRIPFSPDHITDLNIRPKVTPYGWQILFFIPESTIFFFQPRSRWKKTRHIYCNFYKTSEHPDIEHYGSFAPVDLPRPNFHQTGSFVKASIVN